MRACSILRLSSPGLASSHCRGFAAGRSGSSASGHLRHLRYLRIDRRRSTFEPKWVPEPNAFMRRRYSEPSSCIATVRSAAMALDTRRIRLRSGSRVMSG